MEKEYAKYLFEKTIQDYNLIAGQFSRTREYVPEERKKLLLRYIVPGDRVLDIGCGNGRFFEVFQKDYRYFGIDVSEVMVRIARSKYPEGNFQVADALNLPFPDNYFDKIFSLAVIHHIPSLELRLKFLKEAKRVLRPQGAFILTVWNLSPLQMILIGEWERFKGFLRQQVLKIIGKAKTDFGDFFVSWGRITPRYVHCFTVAGLKKIIQRADFRVKDCGVLRGNRTKESNIFIVAEK